MCRSVSSVCLALAILQAGCIPAAPKVTKARNDGIPAPSWRFAAISPKSGEVYEIKGIGQRSTQRKLGSLGSGAWHTLAQTEGFVALTEKGLSHVQFHEHKGFVIDWCRVNFKPSFLVSQGERPNIYAISSDRIGRYFLQANGIVEGEQIRIGEEEGDSLISAIVSSDKQFILVATTYSGGDTSTTRIVRISIDKVGHLKSFKVVLPAVQDGISEMALMGDGTLLLSMPSGVLRSFTLEGKEDTEKVKNLSSPIQSAVSLAEGRAVIASARNGSLLRIDANLQIAELARIAPGSTLKYQSETKLLFGRSTGLEVRLFRMGSELVQIGRVTLPSPGMQIVPLLPEQKTYMKPNPGSNP